MRKILCLGLVLLLCLSVIPVLAAVSPSLKSFSGSGIKKKSPPGKLQKMLLSAMHAAGSTRLDAVLSENDRVVDASGNAVDIQNANIEEIFTPEVYNEKKDGTAFFQMQLADAKAFKTREGRKEVFVVVGIPQANPAADGAPVKYVVLPAEVKNGKVTAVFPAETVSEMRRTISKGWNCVCMVMSRDAAATLFDLPFEDEAVSV